MIIVDIISCIIGFLGLAVACFFGWKLRQWEYLLTSRIAIAYKGKIKMSPQLIEWLQWSAAMTKDGKENARVVYKLGSTTVAIVVPRGKDHGKTVTKVVKTEVPVEQAA
jgi:hypothetical protein